MRLGPKPASSPVFPGSWAMGGQREGARGRRPLELLSSLLTLLTPGRSLGGCPSAGGRAER